MEKHLDILYEDNHLLAVNKPAGMLTHSDITGDKTANELAKEYLKRVYNKPGNVFLQPVHRLDRPTSGLLLFARTSKATTRITAQFKQRSTKKVYYAITDKPPNKQRGTLKNLLYKDKKTNTVQVTTRDTNKAKKAILHYEVIQSRHRLFLLRISPETGRSHQIRIQLSNIGCPILGDFKYNSTYKTDGKSIALHAQSLQFIHPVKKTMMTITCSFPKTSWWNAFKQIEK